MGELLKASCSCGYKSADLFHGIGFRYMEDGHYEEVCYCNKCGKVEVRDGSSMVVCKRCKGEMRFYRQDIEKLKGKKTYGLPYTEYLNEKEFWHCPKCKENTLQFETIGIWD